MGQTLVAQMVDVKEVQMGTMMAALMVVLKVAPTAAQMVSW